MMRFARRWGETSRHITQKQDKKLLDWMGLRQSSKAGFYEQDNEPSGSTQGLFLYSVK
jgi:hypothetical protein